MVRTMGFPRRYSQGPGALRQLAGALVSENIRRAAIILDPVVAAIIRPIIEPELQAVGIIADIHDTPRECSRTGIRELTSRVAKYGPGAIVAFGGGKTIDSAKGVAKALHLHLIVCPTVASSDAPTSRLIVLYDEDHRIDGVEYLAHNPDLILVDTDVIVTAPPRLFAAGIGDAISKKFEAEQCRAAGGSNLFGTKALDTALLLADATYNVLRVDAAEAYRHVCARRPSPAVERVIEATVLLSGLGFESGGLSVAHALIRGLTTLPELVDCLHGELVAYGTLIQLCFERRPTEQLVEMLNIMRSVHLPASLAALGHPQALLPNESRQIASATLAVGYAVNTSPRLTAESLLSAIDSAEKFVADSDFSGAAA
jgi:glycerol dehydrogenase